MTSLYSQNDGKKRIDGKMTAYYNVDIIKKEITLRKELSMCELRDTLENLISTKGKDKVEEESLMEVFFEVRASGALEESLMNDEDYQVASKKTSEKVLKIDEIKLNREQWEVVDCALTACNEKNAEYGRVSYNQGFRDAVRFLTEIFKLA